MAIFNFGGGNQASSDDPEALIKAVTDAGVTFGGSIVLGDSHGVSGGTHHGDVHGTEQRDQ
ncbi:hypothetical protein AB0K92_33210 [Streptomyces sp. NPDC052687]|uniref:hypothetical protein n=1 Tax=Streptomyces sp. NPDC052687 TaxID=3154759 RepID=UPI00341C1D78